MRSNRNAIIVMAIISVITLALSILFHITAEQLPKDHPQAEYISNLFAGTFASALLALFIAIINYADARRRTFEDFFSYAKSAAHNFNQYSLTGPLEQRIDSVLLMNNFNYKGLDDTYGAITFLFHGKRSRQYIYDNIYEPIKTYRSALTEPCFHFRIYKEAEVENTAVMESKIAELESIWLMGLDDNKLYNCNDGNIAVKQNRAYYVVMKGLYSDEYLKIMYPLLYRLHPERFVPSIED